MKVFRATVLLLGLVLSGQSVAYETDALISIRQDSSGLGAKTWELSLKKDGSIVEEQYNIYAKDAGAIETAKTLRRVPEREISVLVSRAAKLIDGLPEDVGLEIVVDPSTKEVKERIVVDPETKAIRIRFNGRKLFAGWSSYESTRPCNETEQFQDTWQRVQDLLRGPDA